MPFFGASAGRSLATAAWAARLGALLLTLAAVLLFGVVPAQADEPSPYDGATQPAVATTPPPADGDKPAPHAPAKPRRGGISPCMTPDPGFGVYDTWVGTGTMMGQVLIPHKGGVTKNGSFDVIFHFHGHEPIRKEFVKAAHGIVLVGIDLGIGSGAYSS